MTITKLTIQHRLQLLAVLMIIGLSFILFPDALRAQDSPSDAQSAIGDPQDVIIKRISELEMYPCNDCHSTEADFNTTPREMKDEHTEKKVHFAFTNGGWCHRCHMQSNYLKLHLQDGKEISFNEAYLLCRECHGPKYRDWKKNIHGKRVGQWAGPRQVSSCPECHDPHEPAFKPLAPKPSPVIPRGKSKSFLKLLFGDLMRL